jgi:hypothetical protein
MSLPENLFGLKILFKFGHFLDFYVIVGRLLVEILDFWLFTFAAYRTDSRLFGFNDLRIDVGSVTVDLPDHFDLFLCLFRPVSGNLFPTIEILVTK